MEVAVSMSEKGRGKGGGRGGGAVGLGGGGARVLPPACLRPPGSLTQGCPGLAAEGLCCRGVELVRGRSPCGSGKSLFFRAFNLWMILLQ